MAIAEGKKEPKSLVQQTNWTGFLDVSCNKDCKKSSPEKDDLVCSKHQLKIGTKLALLVHVIDGYVIEESNVPFKADEDEGKQIEIQDVSGINVPSSLANNSEESKENAIVNASLNSYPEDKDELMSLLPTSCKYCGGQLPDQRAMWGKRFCSVSCGKKYSVTCSQRMRKALHRRTTHQSGPGRERTIIIEAPNKFSTPKRGGRGRGRGRRSLTTPGRSPLHSPNLIDTSELTPELDTSPSCFHFEFPPRFPLGFGLDTHDIENELYDGVEPINSYSFIPAVTWSISQVSQYISSIPGCSSYCYIFEEEEIDGQALLLLTMEHMVHNMNLRLGPALKIASQIRSIKHEYGIQTKTKYLSSPL